MAGRCHLVSYLNVDFFKKTQQHFGTRCCKTWVYFSQSVKCIRLKVRLVFVCLKTSGWDFPFSTTRWRHQVVRSFIFFCWDRNMALSIARIQETLEIWDKSKQNRIVINFSGVHIQHEQQSGFDLLFMIQYHFSCPVFMSISTFRLVHCQSTICEKGNVFVSCGVKFTYTVAATHSDKYDSRARTQAAGRHGGIRICFIFFSFRFAVICILSPDIFLHIYSCGNSLG